MTWPVAVVPVQSEFFLEYNTTIFQSPLTRSQQVLRRQGERWRMTITLPPMLRATAQTIDALLIGLRGAYGTIDLWNFERPTPLGEDADIAPVAETYFEEAGSPTTTTSFVEAGSPTVTTVFAGGALTVIVAGAHYLGDTEVRTSGWYPSTTGMLLAGDFIGINSRLYMVTEDADVDAYGYTTLSIAPPLKSAISSGTEVVRTRPTASFRLVDDGQPNRRVDGPLYNFTLSFVEAQ